MASEEATSGGVAAASALARKTLSYRWVCLGLLFLGILVAFFIRLAPAVAIPNLRDEFVLTI